MGSRNLVFVVIIVLLIMVVGCGNKEKTKFIDVTPYTSPTYELEQKLIQKLTEVCEAADRSIEYPDTIENEIIAKSLATLYSGHFKIVDPKTSIGIYTDFAESIEFLKQRKKSILYSCNRTGYDITNIFEQLLEINKSPGSLTIKSSIPDKYYVNYGNQFYNYQIEVSKDEYKKGSGWLEFIDKNFLHLNLFLEISRPAYDAETGYVLIYCFAASYWGTGGGGFGALYFMKYLDGNMTLIDKFDLIAPSMHRVDYEPDFSKY